MSMFKCLNPRALGRPLSWEETLPLAKMNGFEGVDLMIDPNQAASQYKDALAQFGLRPGGTGLPCDFRGDAGTYEPGLAALDAIVERAAAIGCTRFFTWILSFSDTLPMRENFHFHADRLSNAAKILQDHGCRLGLEFLGPKTLREGHRYSFIHTMEQMLELCAQVGPNCGLLLDSWHWHTSLGTIEDILVLNPRNAC